MPTPVNRPAPAATELLFSISRNGRQIACELKDFGDRGVEVQFLSDREPFYNLRLATHALALQWAERERRAWGWFTEEEAAPANDLRLARI
jgi:hypothetical protein